MTKTTDVYLRVMVPKGGSIQSVNYRYRLGEIIYAESEAEYDVLDSSGPVGGIKGISWLKDDAKCLIIEFDHEPTAADISNINAALIHPQPAAECSRCARLERELERANVYHESAASKHLDCEKQLEALTKERDQLRRELQDALAIMDRARGILTKHNPTPDNNWGMLKTEYIRARVDLPLPEAPK